MLIYLLILNNFTDNDHIKIFLKRINYLTLHHEDNFDSTKGILIIFFRDILKSYIPQNSITEFKASYADINSKIA